MIGKRYRYVVKLIVSSWSIEAEKRVSVAKKFVFDNYDDVQNLIGYMVDGSDSLEITIGKEEINEQEA